MINYISDNITEAKITSVTTGDVCYNPELGKLMVFDGNSWAYNSIEHKHSYEWYNCPNCGAPFGTGDVCEYCNTMRK